MVTPEYKLGTQKTKTKTETRQINSTEKAAKENREISQNLLNELTSRQLIPKLDIDQAQNSTGSPTVTGNKTVTETNAERSGTSAIKKIAKDFSTFRKKVPS